MSDNVKHWLDMVAAALAAWSGVVDHLVSIVAGGMAISWYIYRFIATRKDQNGNVG